MPRYGGRTFDDLQLGIDFCGHRRQVGAVAFPRTATMEPERRAERVASFSSSSDVTQIAFDLVFLDDSFHRKGRHQKEREEGQGQRNVIEYSAAAGESDRSGQPIVRRESVRGGNAVGGASRHRRR